MIAITFHLDFNLRGARRSHSPAFGLQRLGTSMCWHAIWRDLDDVLLAGAHDRALRRDHVHAVSADSPTDTFRMTRWLMGTERRSYTRLPRLLRC